MQPEATATAEAANPLNPLEQAIAQVDIIIREALNSAKHSLALRAIELQLRLRGFIKDKRMVVGSMMLRLGLPPLPAEDEEADPEFEPPQPKPARPATQKVVTFSDLPKVSARPSPRRIAPVISGLPATGPVKPVKPAAAASKLFDDLMRSGASDLKGSAGGLALMAGFPGR
jgi:hypothetical protein